MDDSMNATFDLAGVAIEVQCEEPMVAELVGSRLRSLETERVGDPDLVVEIRGPGSEAGWPLEPTGHGRPIYDAPGAQIQYFESSDQLFVDFEHGARLLCTLRDGLISIGITGSELSHAVLAAHPLLTVALVETMKRFGRYPLHAAALALNGKGVLVPGASGAGKSTTSVTLVRAGFDFLADDTVFLTRSTDKLWVDGFPDEVDVTENTVGRIPELSHLAGAPLLPGRDKYSFRVEEIFGITPLVGCRPAFLIAPRVVDQPGSELEPLPASEAFLALVPNVLMTDPAASQAHLDMLADLVEMVPCLRFRVGSDLDDAAACIAELVA
jgi:hypothetical protein